MSNSLQSPALYGLQLLMYNAEDKPHLKTVFIRVPGFHQG